MTILEPWMPVATEAQGLERELGSELGTRHQLKGRNMRAIARRRDNDDVLFVSTDEPTIVAVVHLTWANRPENDPRWPATTLFESIEDWAERRMRVDHDDL
jgi:hypothetical protein